MAQFKQAQGELSSAISRLLMVSENYPELKANQAFAGRNRLYVEPVSKDERSG